LQLHNAEGVRKLQLHNADGIRKLQLHNAEGVRKFQPRVVHNPGSLKNQGVKTLKALASQLFQSWSA